MKPSSGHYIPIAILECARRRGARPHARRVGQQVPGLHGGSRRPRRSLFRSDVRDGRHGRARCARRPALHELSRELVEHPGRGARAGIAGARPTPCAAARFRRTRAVFAAAAARSTNWNRVADAPITVRAEHGKLATAPRGLRGGLAGSAGGCISTATPVPDKLPVTLHRGDVLQLHVPGSGGMYPPADARPRRRWRATSPMASSRREAARAITVMPRRLEHAADVARVGHGALRRVAYSASTSAARSPISCCWRRRPVA